MAAPPAHNYGPPPHMAYAPPPGGVMQYPQHPHPAAANVAARDDHQLLKKIGSIAYFEICFCEYFSRLKQILLLAELTQY